MPHFRTVCLSAIALPALAIAQATNPIGFSQHLGTSLTDRIGANTVTADILHHFDSRHYRDWLLDPADPTGSTYKCRAVRFVVQDQVGNTSDTVGCAGYGEDAANPNFPATQAPWFRTAPISLPATPNTGPVAYVITVTLPTSLPSIPKGDVWIGATLTTPTNSVWPLDGTSLEFAMEQNPGPSIGTLANNQVACYVPIVGGVPTGPAVYPTSTVPGRKQLYLEVFADVAGGVCLAQRGTTSTTGFVSGLHPDIYNARGANPPVLDEIGFAVKDGSLPNAVGFVIVAFAGYPLGSVPLRNLSPLLAHANTQGNVCIDLVPPLSSTQLITTDALGSAEFRLPLTPQARAAVQAMSSPTQPFDVWYQAFLIDTSTAGAQVAMHATGCGIQHL